MMTYLLLRKNKEYGPFSLEQLRSLPIFHSDLLWVEGQSVCWLHPDEIRELKGLAVDEPKELAGNAPDNLSGEVLIANDKFVLKIEEAGKEITGPGKQMKSNTGVKNDFSANYLSSEINTAEFKIPASQIKKPNQDVNKKALYSLLPASIKVVVYATALILTGLVAGIFIGRNSSKKNGLVNNNQNTVAVPGMAPEIRASETERYETIDKPEKESEDTIFLPDYSIVSETDLPVKKTPVSVKKNIPAKPIVVQRETQHKPLPENNAVFTNPDEQTVRNKTTENNSAPALPVDILSFVSVSTNDYQVGSFGGIKNLELTVKNDSKYDLELVTVQLQYFKPSDELLKTENIQFNSIASQGSKTQSVSKTNRGVKVKCKVVKVVATAQGTNLSGF